MARDDTRLHRLEAMVAGLLAWQNVAEKSLAELEQRLCSGQPGCDLWAGGPEPAAEHETRVLMAKGSERGLSRAPQGDRAAQNEAPIAAPTSHATQQRDSRPAPAQAVHEHEWIVDRLGREVCKTCGVFIEHRPKQAAQPAPQQPRSGGG